MLKHWKSAPTILKTLVVYWHLWPVAFIAALGFMYTASPDGEVVGHMRELWDAEYQITPIAAWINGGLLLLYFLCPLFAWGMLARRRTFRKLLEALAWLIFACSLIDFVYPQFWYFELETVPPEFTDTIEQWSITGFMFVIIDMLVVLSMRSKQVREHANVF